MQCIEFISVLKTIGSNYISVVSSLRFAAIDELLVNYTMVEV